MRFIVVNEASDVNSLSARIVKKGQRQLSAATLAQLKTLNPHVEFDHIGAGAVLLLPAAADLDETAGQPLGGNALHDSIVDTAQGFHTVLERMHAASALAANEQAAVDAVVNSAPLNGVIANDKRLQAQLDGVKQRFVADERARKEAIMDVDAMQTAVQAELDAFRRLFGM